MRVRAPKPLHGWRAFVGEVGIIVLGVLVALLLGAIADDWNWRRKVADARQVIRYEVGHNMQLYKWRVEQQDCIDRRLDQLAIILQQANATGRLPPVGRIGGPGSGTWPEGVWQSQLSAETATHFPAIELASLARIYRFIEMTRDQNALDSSAWLSLQTMVGPGRAIDAGTVDRLIQAVVTARRVNASYANSELSIQRILQQSRLGPDFPQLDPKNPPVIGTGRDVICKPIRTLVPAAYGLKVSR